MVFVRGDTVGGRVFLFVRGMGSYNRIGKGFSMGNLHSQMEINFSKSMKAPQIPDFRHPI